MQSAEDLDLPDDFTMSTPYGDVEGFGFGRNDSDPRARAEVESLPEGVVVLDSFPCGPQSAPPPDPSLPAGTVVHYPFPHLERFAVAEAFRRGLARAKHGELQVAPGSGMRVVAAVPPSCEGGGVEMRRFARHGKTISLEMVSNCKTPPATKPPPMERQRRSLVAVPLLLSAGAYEVQVTWHNVEECPDGALRSSEPLVSACAFTVPKRSLQSKVVRGPGVELRALVDGVCRIPRDNERTCLNVGLLVTNRSGREISMPSDGFSIRLRALDNHPLHYYCRITYVRKEKPPVCIAADHSHLFLLATDLVPSRDGGFSLVGYNGAYWGFQGVSAGRYALSACYRALPHTADAVQTNEVEFEVAGE